ncbi:MAG: carboxypeptidase-like regulatory domain-containing protein [Bryobacterales bacterium]
MALKHTLVAMTASLLLAASAFAQATGSGTVGGAVTDPSGGVIPGAHVTLSSVDRGVEKAADTNEAGLYVFPDLTPGNYSLRVQSDGFDTYELTSFRLEVGQRATVNVTLQVGQVSNVITVEAAGEAILLETDSNALGTLVNSKQVNELPLNGRNFLQLALLAAGTNDAAGRADASGQTGHPGRSVVIGGVKSTSNSYTINGIQVRGARLGELAVNLSVANVDEFKVQQSFFMPDQGPNPAMVNVNTKGGTNAFHGQAFEFLRNVDLDARNFYAPASENLKRNQFGFAVGGPIVKDKIWFYGGYEGLRERKAFAQGVYTPTQQMFGGDFTQVSDTIYDPLTLNEAGGTRDPFPNNVIPTTRINSVSKGLLQYYLPGASLAQRPNNLFVNPLDTLDDDQFNIRIDTALTDTQSLFGQFIYSKSPGVQEGPFPLSGAFYPNDLQLGMVQHTWTISPSFVNTLRFGASRNVALFSNEGRDHGDILDPLGIQNTFDVRGVTAQGIQDYSGFGRANGDLGNLDNNYQLDEGATYIRGNHQFRFGTSIRYRRTWQQNSNAGAHGNLAYQKRFTAALTRNAAGALAPGAGGNAFADFLLGMPSTGSVRGLPMLPYRFTQYMPYIQDTWKLRRNFTVNWGASWFYDSIADPQGFARDLPHGFDSQTGLLKFAALGEINPKVITPDKNNFAPRLGFAWQLDDKTVIRSGAGVYYSDQQLIELQFSAVGPPNRSIDIINTGDLIPTYQLGMNIFPALNLPPLDKDFAANLPAGQAPFLLAEDGRTPYVSQWNFSVQRTLDKNNFVEVAYMGNSGHRQQNRYDYNQCIVGADLACDRNTRPYLRYTSLLRADYNGNSTYNALAAKYQHRTSAGLNFRLEYTWAKGLTDSWEAGGATNAQITNFRALDKDQTSFDVRHRAVTSIIWDVPFGRGRRHGQDIPRALDLLAGGWTLTGIGTFSTGTPFILTTANRTGSPFVNHRPNRTCDGSLGSVNPRQDPHFLDTSCFSVAPQGYFGNSSRNPLHGPGINNWDIGIQKNFSITEQTRIQFRGEMFNAFNHAQFGNPNSNASSGSFGLIGSARAPRLIQLGLKLLF